MYFTGRDLISCSSDSTGNNIISWNSVSGDNTIYDSELSGIGLSPVYSLAVLPNGIYISTLFIFTYIH